MSVEGGQKLMGKYITRHDYGTHYDSVFKTTPDLEMMNCQD